MRTAGRPYRRSGLDAAVDLVDRWPGWTPAKYLALAAFLVGSVHLTAMVDGSLAWGTLSLPLVGFAVWPAYVLAAKAFVRRSARSAVEDLGVALTCDDAGVDRIRYRLTTQPAGATAVAAAAFVVASLPSTFFDARYVESTGLFTSTVSAALHAVILVVSLWLTGAAGYGILHVLRTIDDVYVRHVRIDVLAPQELFALSRLAMHAALAVLAMQYVFVGANPAVLGSRAVVGQLIAWQVLAVTLFVLPLWNAHRLLARAKAALARDVGLRLEHVTRLLHEAVDEERFETTTALKDALVALEASQRVVARASTWPWSAETPRVLGSALLLPLVAWALQQGLTRLFAGGLG